MNLTILVRFCIGIFLWVTVAENANAQDASAGSSGGASSAVLTLLDASQTVSIAQGKCLVTVTSDKDALIQDVDKLRNEGFLNSSYDDNYFLSNPAMLLGVMAFEASSAATDGFFSENSDVESCQFKQTFKYTDSYGNDQSMTLYTYDFDRSLWKKINWDKFNPANIAKVSHNFQPTPAMLAMAQVAEQADQ